MLRSVSGGLAAHLRTWLHMRLKISQMSVSLITSKASFKGKEKSGLFELPEWDHMTPILYFCVALSSIQLNFSKSQFEMIMTLK